MTSYNVFEFRDDLVDFISVLSSIRESGVRNGPGTHCVELVRVHLQIQASDVMNLGLYCGWPVHIVLVQNRDNTLYFHLILIEDSVECETKHTRNERRVT
jgi:hypothetical protein